MKTTSTLHSDSQNLFDISFIVPCHNEAGNIETLTQQIEGQFDQQGIASEIVFIDDGSTDDTLDKLRLIAGFSNKELSVNESPSNELLANESYSTPPSTSPSTPSLTSSSTSSSPAISVASFSRNFGKESALHAGLSLSHGATVCFIDADMQQDPLVAREMYDFLMSHKEYDIVAAYQDKRHESAIVSWLKNWFYRFFNATSDEVELPAHMSDFRVFRRPVADALLALPEYFRFTKGLFAWVGFSTYAMPYSPNKRLSGESKWSLRALFGYSYSGITSFSTWPLKIQKFIGGTVALLSGLYFLYVLIVDYCIFGVEVPGYTTLVCLILLFGGLQLAAIGIVGDYLARSYIEGKHRPLYLIRETFCNREYDCKRVSKTHQ